MSLDWIITLCALTIFGALAVVANWKAGQPWDDMNPRVLPWRWIMILSGFCIAITLVHLINLLGYETGPGKSPFR